MSNPTPSHLTNNELTEEIIRLAHSGRDTTVRLVTHLAEFEARDLHLAARFPSLFAYCTEVLRLSEHEAYHRILAARTARQHPRIVVMLREGRLTLTTVRLIAPLLTDANFDEVLDAAAGLSKRQVEELVARRAPKPDVPSSVRKVPMRAPLALGPVVTASAVSPPDASLSAASLPVVVMPVALAPARPALVRPLAPERYEVRFTASAETCAKLKRAQELLRHAVPSGDTAVIVDRALTLLVADLERRKLGATARPRSGRASSVSSRKPPAHVRRAVCRRDGNRCAFVSKDGRRCEGRGFLEFHHVIPYAMGGETTVENIQLRCRAHNAYEGRLDFPESTRFATSRTDGAPPTISRMSRSRPPNGS